MNKLTPIAGASKALVRARTRDVAFQFRMGTGYPGDVNRTHPASILPRQHNATNPVAGFGRGVLVDAATNTVRNVLASDTAITTIYGVSVRSYPTQQNTSQTAAFGVGAPPINQPVDILRNGYFMASVLGSPSIDGQVYMWVAASTGSHVQGGFETTATGGSTVALTNVTFSSPAGSDGVAELFIRER